MLQRHLAPDNGESDFDFIVIGDNEKLNKNTLSLITELIADSLRKYKKTLCWQTNPEHIQLPLLKNLRDAKEMIVKAFRPTTPSRGIRLDFKEIAYFYPTFPRQCWINNLILIKSALSTIKKENPETYDVIALTIYQRYTEYLQLKKTHITNFNHSNIVASQARNILDEKAKGKIPKEPIDLITFIINSI